MKQYIKVDAVTLGIIDNSPVKVSLAELKKEEQTYLAGIADCEAKLVVIREKMAQAETLGIVEKMVQSEVVPVEEQIV